ncbi:MAG: cadherin-like domain-containing protein, partial [Nitrosomonas sp.]|nr:cadherin-like domain-containing protein [Nitrosomonas sp.]
ISVTYDVTDGLDSVGNTATITITGENDDPIATDDGNPDPTGFITDEDTQFTTSNVLLNDTDADSGDVLSISSIDTTGTVGLVTDNGNGTFNYDPNGAFESLGVGDSATDSFVYTVSDGNGGVDTATVTINISGVNDIPVISSQNSAAVNENTLVVGQLVANDPDAGDTLVISIEGGADAGLFTFDNSGIFSFVTAPDFELPSDFDNNNIYEITVGVSDGKVLVTQDVTITVSDVNEGGSPNIIEGTASSDNLIGTNTEDILFGHGGAFDFFTGNSGADIFVFTATPGNGREIGTINDYVPGEDSIDLDGSVVSSSFGFGLSTYLFLDGGDFDTLIVNGVGSVNDITFV